MDTCIYIYTYIHACSSIYPAPHGLRPIHHGHFWLYGPHSYPLRSPEEILRARGVPYRFQPRSGSRDPPLCRPHQASASWRNHGEREDFGSDVQKDAVCSASTLRTVLILSYTCLFYLFIYPSMCPSIYLPIYIYKATRLLLDLSIHRLIYL